MAPTQTEPTQFPQHSARRLLGVQAPAGCNSSYQWHQWQIDYLKVSRWTCWKEEEKKESKHDMQCGFLNLETVPAPSQSHTNVCTYIIYKYKYNYIYRNYELYKATYESARTHNDYLIQHSKTNLTFCQLNVKTWDTLWYYDNALPHLPCSAARQDLERTPSRRCSQHGRKRTSWQNGPQDPRLSWVWTEPLTWHIMAFIECLKSSIQ